MKTLSEINPSFRKDVVGLISRLPKVRKLSRRMFWDWQRRRFDKVVKQSSTDSRLIFFEAYSGRSYACSPKAIYESMLADERFQDYSLVWCFGRKYMPAPGESEVLDKARWVVRGSDEYFETIARAGTIITNTRLPEYVSIREDQTYIQCWHGTPLKRLGFDVSNMDGALNTALELAERFAIDAQKWTYLISPSKYTSEHLCSAFGLSPEEAVKKVLEIGYPRNDVLISKGRDSNFKDMLKQQYGLPQDKKILLYAPTWRDNLYQSGQGYTFNCPLEFDILRQLIGNDWIVLYRSHYYITNSENLQHYRDFVFNVSDVQDINDLYLVSDALATDYSSVVFDYANLKRPMYLFVPDIESYEQDLRGFYFDIRKVPGPLCSTTEELGSQLCQIDAYFENYENEYTSFIQVFCPLDDGHASERVLNYLT